MHPPNVCGDTSLSRPLSGVLEVLEGKKAIDFARNENIFVVFTIVFCLDTNHRSVSDRLGSFTVRHMCSSAKCFDELLRCGKQLSGKKLVPVHFI